MSLVLLMEHAKSSRFYPIQRAELGLGAEKPGACDMTRQVPWMRWENFFMRHQAAQSVARSFRKEQFKAVPLSELLAPGGAIYIGDGPLLRSVLVDASTARTQVLKRDVLAILSARGRGVGQERAKTIYQLLYGTAGADAVVFYRSVGPEGQWIMVMQQYKHSKADVSARVSPAIVVADWEKLPKEKMMGKKLFKAWRGRIVSVKRRTVSTRASPASCCPRTRMCPASARSTRWWSRGPTWPLRWDRRSPTTLMRWTGSIARHCSRTSALDGAGDWGGGGRGNCAATRRRCGPDAAGS